MGYPSSRQDQGRSSFSWMESPAIGVEDLLFKLLMLHLLPRLFYCPQILVTKSKKVCLSFWFRGMRLPNPDFGTISFGRGYPEAMEPRWLGWKFALLGSEHISGEDTLQVAKTSSNTSFMWFVYSDIVIFNIHMYDIYIYTYTYIHIHTQTWFYYLKHERSQKLCFIHLSSQEPASSMHFPVVYSVRRVWENHIDDITWMKVTPFVDLINMWALVFVSIG